MWTDMRCNQSLVLLSVLLISEWQSVGLSVCCGAAVYASWLNKSITQYTHSLVLACGVERRVGYEANFPVPSWIKKLSSSQLLVDWNWELNLRTIWTVVHGQKSEWQVFLWRRALRYLRRLCYRQIITLSIRVPFPALWPLLCLMACSYRTVSGCLHTHHYPTRSPLLINDKRVEYWLVNLQSGTIQYRWQNYMNLTNTMGCALRVKCVCGFEYVYPQVGINPKLWSGLLLLLNLESAETPASTQLY